MRQARQSRLPGTLVTAVGTVAPSVIKVAGDAANGVVGADIISRSRAVQVQPLEPGVHEADPEDVQDDAGQVHGAWGGALQIWAKAANKVKSLDKEKVAKRIRGGSFKDTIFGDVSFEPSGQMKSSYSFFTVKDQKIVIQSGDK